MVPRKHDGANDRRGRAAYEKNVCVRGNIQRRSTNSVVVTDMQKLNTRPPRDVHTIDVVQRLTNRTNILLTNEAGESNTTEERVFFSSRYAHGRETSNCQFPLILIL